ncbi:MAG: glycosyltransferase family 4 protein [Flavobacteriales bacterium]|nr:glycosyltransferase family 4 protein [Flavobacteriales bacterium]
MSSTVCMFVYNNCTTDARVLKEAASLVKGGYKVKIIAIMDKTTLPYEIRDGIEIIRVIKNPLHYRIFSGEIITELFKAKKKNVLKNLRKDYKQAKEIKDTIPKKKTSTKLNITQLTWKEFLKSFFQELKTNTLKIILYRWLFYLLNGLLRIIRLIVVKIFVPPLKSILMTVHKPLCFHDFYKRSLILNIEEPSDIYHGHDLHTVPTAFKTAKRTKAKVVYDAHELYTEMSGLKPIERKLYTRIERKYAPKVDALITVNESIATELKDRYHLRKKPSIIFNCPEVSNNIIMTDNDVLREKLNIPKETKIVLYQGGYSINRGLFNLIKSAKYINNGIVVFMGWGRIEEELKDEVKKLQLEDKVIFTPGVPQNELLNHSKSAEVGVIPYQFVGLNNYYTSPNKLFEYINAGVPIAGSDFPELKRVIDKYNIGETFDPESPKSIATAINKVLDDSEYQKTLKENTKLAAKDFTWEQEEKKLIEIYSKLVNE